MECRDKEVDFEHYCPKCKHWKESEACDSCHECLHHCSNEYSHKPVMFEEARK